SIILHTAKVFEPDIFLVDKEPGGLKGEVLATLEMLRQTSTCCILGLRDVMDDPEQLKLEWERKNVRPTLQELYDEIWVYGPPLMGNPIKGAFDAEDTELQRIYDKCTHTGFLQRELPEHGDTTELDIPDEPYLLVTPGGGGDGVELIDSVLKAYEKQAQPLPALLVLGPFMPLNVRDDLLQRAAELKQVEAITFTPNFEILIKQARAVVAMGGYNTFCELLSFDKPALIVPRVVPRLEQLIRAEKAASLGLVSLLHPDKLDDTDAVIAALQRLLEQEPPSHAGKEHLLNGLSTIIDRVGELVSTQNPESNDLSTSQ
ncbi:MAG: glycosyltransferase family protein, partial [Granulosicoccaceae bacterium]